MELQTEISSHIARIIRTRSQSGQLIEAEEIRIELAEIGAELSEAPDEENPWESALAQALEHHNDLRQLANRHGRTFYHSIESLSESYAAILVWKSEDPLRMIAEVVRENSRTYPRPVPLDAFEESPFGLTRDEIVACLAAMAEQDEYRDIVRTETSIGTPYLFSTQYLDADHGTMLAEWFDVGQSANP